MKAQRGMTLIETAVAIALLVIIVISILSAFSAVSIAASRYGQLASLDRLTRSDAEYIKSQPYSTTGSYANLTAAGYAFSYRVLNYSAGPPQSFSSSNPDSGLQEIVLTVTGPNGISEPLDFMKVQP